MKLVDGVIKRNDIVWYLQHDFFGGREIIKLKVMSVHPEFIKLERIEGIRGHYQIGTAHPSFDRVFTKFENAEAKLVELLLCKD